MCDDDLWFITTLSWFAWAHYIFYALKRNTGVNIKIFEGDDLDSYYYVDFSCKYFNIGICRYDLCYRNNIKADYDFDGNVCMRIDYFCARYEEGKSELVKFLRLVTEERQEDFLWLDEDTIILQKRGESFYTEATEKYIKSAGRQPYPFEFLGPYYENLVVKKD